MFSLQISILTEPLLSDKLMATEHNTTSNNEMNTCLIVFVKNPIPNQVKTRLLPILNAEQAAALYCAFLTDWCDALSTISDVDLIIANTPPESQSELEKLIGKHVTYIPQKGIDLGERLSNATKWGAENGYKKIIIVGSDSPTLPKSFISDAVVSLDTRDFVIGPSLDGGYYLIGFTTNILSEAIPSVFEGIAWSTANVLKQTLDRIKSINSTLKLLPPWYDVDTPEDLALLNTHLHAIRLAEGSTQAERTERLLSDLIKENSLWEN